MLATVASCKKALVGTGFLTRKYSTYLVRTQFLALYAFFSDGCLHDEHPDYSRLAHQWV